MCKKTATNPPTSNSSTVASGISNCLRIGLSEAFPSDRAAAIHDASVKTYIFILD